MTYNEIDTMIKALYCKYKEVSEKVNVGGYSSNSFNLYTTSGIKGNDGSGNINNKPIVSNLSKLYLADDSFSYDIGVDGSDSIALYLNPEIRNEFIKVNTNPDAPNYMYLSDGSLKSLSSIGANIGNSDLTINSSRVLTQKADYKQDLNGNAYSLSGVDLITPQKDKDYILALSSGDSVKKISLNDISSGGTPNLDQVTTKGNYSGKPISFSVNNSDAVLGFDSSTYSYYFGSINPLSKGYYNISLGYSAMNNTVSGNYNISIGSYNSTNMTAGNENVLIGSDSFNQVQGDFKNSSTNTTLGYGIASNLMGSKSNVFIGAYNGSNLTSNRVSIDDVERVSKATADAIRGNVIRAGYDSATRTVSTCLNTIVGSYNNSDSKAPDRAVLSTIVGSCNLGLSMYMNYNNIVVGSNNFMNNGNGSTNNSIVIGNHINLPNQVDALVIGSKSNRRIDSSEAMLYGDMKNDKLMLNASVSLNTRLIKNAQNDSTFDKVLVINNDGTIGSMSSGSDINVVNAVCDDSGVVSGYPFKSLVIPEGTIKISDKAFVDEWLIGKLKLPSTLKSIGYHSFMGTGIKKLIIPEGVVYLGDYFFSSNYVSYIDLPSTLDKDSLQYIGDDNNYEGLWQETLVGPIYSINESSDSVYLRSETLKTLILRMDYVFSLRKLFLCKRSDDGSKFTVDFKGTVYVPDNLIEQYKNDVYWKKYAIYTTFASINTLK